MTDLSVIFRLARDGGDNEGIEQLISAKPELISARDDIGRTPLHHAVEHAKLETVRLLLAHGASVSTADSYGRTPLFFSWGKERTEILRTLIEDFKSDVHAEDIYGLSALHNCCHHGPAETGRLLLTLMPASDILAYIHAVDKRDGNTMLHTLCSLGKIEFALVLLEFGADPTLLNHEDKSAFDCFANEFTRRKLFALWDGGAEVVISHLKEENHELWFWLIRETLPGVPEKVRYFIERCPELAFAKDDQGRVAIAVATSETRKIIESEVYFCGRYQLEPGPLAHKSATAVVVYAGDFGVDQEYRNVAEMQAGSGQGGMDRDQFKRALITLGGLGFSKANELLLASDHFRSVEE